MKALCSVVIVVLLAVATTMAQDKPRGTQLKNAELIKLFASNAIFEGYNPSSRHLFSQIFQSSGVLLHQLIDDAGRSAQEVVKWSIDGDTVCFKFAMPVPACRHIYKVDDETFESWPAVGGNRVNTLRMRRHPVGA